MKLNSLFAVVASVGQAVATPSPSTQQSDFWHWKPPGRGDVRAPCPMLNTLANHGFLPHSGKNISQDNVVDALFSALNFERTLSAFLFNNIVNANLTSALGTVNLDALATHNLLEHDGSLSRGDFYFGDNHSFNRKIFAETKSYWIGPVIDIKEAAKARLARVHRANATNPTFKLNQLGSQLSFGETGSYIVVFGDRVAGTVKKARVEYFFENERLPMELGWTRPDSVTDRATLGDIFVRIVNATTLLEEEKAVVKRGGGLHAGR